jgi:hypothetical protein
LIPRISTALRQRVIQRARDRCEYCGLAQAGQEATFHIDHVIPIAAGGLTAADNLALACVSCSLRKGARQQAQDPETNQPAPLFSPRHDTWDEHFGWDGIRVFGRTSTGRATIASLELNRPVILAIRSEEVLFGRHPPS